MNQATHVAWEAPITFSKVKFQFYIKMYNTRISYPPAIIILAMGNIKECFWFVYIHANSTGAFGFIADNYYNLAIAMVFGSTTLASSWEPFQRMIKTLSDVYANEPELVIKHKKYLNMIGWAELDPNTPITPAIACKINTSMVSINGVE